MGIGRERSQFTKYDGDRNAEQFLNVIQDGFYQQLVREPTRQGNVLDLVFTNNETLVSQVEIGDIFDESDHNEIRFKINAKRKEQNIALRGSGMSLDKRNTHTIRILSSSPRTPSICKCESVHCSFLGVMELTGPREN